MTDKALATVKGQITKAQVAANGLEVTDEAGMATGTDLLGKIKTVGKLAREEKDKVLKPLLEATGAERDRWRPLETDLSAAALTVKTKMEIYARAELKAKREEEERIAKQVEQNRIKPETAVKKFAAIEEPKKEVVGKTAKASVKKVWSFRITDESVVPKKYWVVDKIALRKDVMAGQEVPGAERYEDVQIASR